MGFEKQILGAALGVQSAAVLADNVNFLKRGKGKKKKKGGGLLGQGIKNIVGVSMIKAQADIISGL